MFPEGMFIDNVVEVAKRELAWEVDYIREAECTKKYRELVTHYPDYYVPVVIGKKEKRDSELHRELEYATISNIEYQIELFR